MSAIEMHVSPVRRPRIIMLTQWFDPEPTFKGRLFAEALEARGFDVEVITGFPNYPGGKLYPGFRIRPIQRERIGHVEVTRLPLYPSHDQNRLGRITNYVSFFLSACLYLLLGARRADIAYVYHPPVTVGCAAAIARFFRRTPTVIDIQDLWPDTLKATGMIQNQRLLDLIGRVCRWLYRQVEHIVVLSPGFRDVLIARGVPAAKISVIYNWADEEAVSSSNQPVPLALTEGERFRVMFAGNMGRAQALKSVLAAADLLRTRAPHVEICLMGGGVEVPALRKQVSESHLSNVRFLPQVPMSEVGAFLNAADCLLVHLRDDPLFSITIPSKTQAYLAAGKPIIMAVRGDAADLVREGGGLVVPPEDPGALAHAIADLAGRPVDQIVSMGCAAKRHYDEHLSLEKGVDAFARLFRQIVDRDRRR
jgi:colanic acid biosynthesis glycosyl transferase WcaI